MHKYSYNNQISATGLVSALGQCSNGLAQIMHSPSANALSCPWPLLHCPHALKPHNAQKLVYIYYFKTSSCPTMDLNRWADGVITEQLWQCQCPPNPTIYTNVLNDKTVKMAYPSSRVATSLLCNSNFSYHKMVRAYKCWKVNILEYFGQRTAWYCSLSRMLFRHISSPTNFPTHSM